MEIKKAFAFHYSTHFHPRFYLFLTWQGRLALHKSKRKLKYKSRLISDSAYDCCWNVFGTSKQATNPAFGKEEPTGHTSVK